jgi:hypothetical protein
LAVASEGQRCPVLAGGDPEGHAKTLGSERVSEGRPRYCLVIFSDSLEMHGNCPLMLKESVVAYSDTICNHICYW